MKNVIDVLYYTEDFTNKIISEVFTIYDLWSIRPLQNIRKVLCSGLASDPDSFRRFMEDHANKEKPQILFYL
jgi:hypothetical protein